MYPELIVIVNGALNRRGKHVLIEMSTSEENGIDWYVLELCQVLLDSKK
jgi:hypothetical protein